VLAPSPNGASVLVAMPDGNVMLYDASADTFTVSRKDLTALQGPYAASSYNSYVVGNNWLNASLVSVGTLETASGAPSGFAFVDQAGFRTTVPASTSPGVIERVDPIQAANAKPTAMAEAPLVPSVAWPFTRTLAPLADHKDSIVLLEGLPSGNPSDGHGSPDGITGMEDVVMEAWQKTKLQKCVVHKMRNVLNDIRPKEKAAVAEDLKQVFDNFDAGATRENAYKKIEAFIAKWETKYPTIDKHFNEKTLAYYFTYIDYPPEVRRMIYTTNSIENLNKHIRKGTKNKLSFESPERLLDYVFIIIKEFEHKNWSRFPVNQFSVIHSAQTH